MLINLIAVGLSVIIILLIFVFLVLRSRIKKNSVAHKIVQAPSIALPIEAAIEDFSGDNLCDTQLDLATAYLELHQYEKAKQLLKAVITHGSAMQALEARKMFSFILKQERLS